MVGASGKVGRPVVAEARERGHEVVAVVRTPSRLDPSTLRGVELRPGDVTSLRTFPDLDDVDAIVSTLGISKGDGPGALVAGARLLATARPPKVWLGALGSGASTGAGGALYQAIMRMAVGKELTEKAEADQIALEAGLVVLHAPDLKKGPVSPRRHLAPLDSFRRPVLPPRISRATLAALLLDAAGSASETHGILVPLA